MKKLFLFAAALATMVSCSKSETSFDEVQGEIAFKAIATRATETLGADIKMGVHAQLGSSEYFTNAEFGKNSQESWSGNPARYWPHTGSLDFLLYAPYTQTGIEMNSSEITYTNVPDQLDFLYGAEKLVGKTKADGSMPINLKHAKAVVKFTASADVADIYRIDKIVLSKISKTGNVTVNYGTPEDPVVTVEWTPTATVNHDFITSGGNALTEKAVEVGTEINILPAAAQTEFTVHYSMKSTPTAGKDKYVECPVYTVKLDGAWEHGNRYIYNIQFKGSEITFKPTVELWNDVVENHEKN